MTIRDSRYNMDDLIALFPVLYNNQILYDSPFYGGYREMNRSIENISQAGSGFWKSIFSGYFGGTPEI